MPSSGFTGDAAATGRARGRLRRRPAADCCRCRTARPPRNYDQPGAERSRSMARGGAGVRGRVGDRRGPAFMNNTARRWPPRRRAIYVDRRAGRSASAPARSTANQSTGDDSYGGGLFVIGAATVERARGARSSGNLADYGGGGIAVHIAGTIERHQHDHHRQPQADRSVGSSGGGRGVLGGGDPSGPAIAGTMILLNDTIWDNHGGTAAGPSSRAASARPTT